MAAPGCIGASECWHWSFAQPHPTGGSNLLSPASEQPRRGQRRKRRGPDNVFLMPVDDGERITTIFPSDHSGKLSKILPHQRKVHSRGARGKGFAIPCPSRTPSRLKKRNFLLCLDSPKYGVVLLSIALTIPKKPTKCHRHDLQSNGVTEDLRLLLLAEIHPSTPLCRSSSLGIKRERRKHPMDG
jgi:hypothetical protein